jgi:tetratricopeptide (TPR) repeat protein
VDYDRLRELQQKFDENPRRYFAPLANEYRKGGQPKRAIEICRAHLAQMPGHMSGQIVYGQALFEAGEWDEAKTVFERALTLDPENLIALRSLGDMALQAGNTSEARTWYARLLEADPKDAAVIALMSEIGVASEVAIPTIAAQEAEPAETPPLQAAERAPEPEPPALPEASPVVAESAGTHVEEPAGMEPHYPAEAPEEPALASASTVETGEAIENITSAKEDVPGALDSLASPSDAPAPEEAVAPAAAQFDEAESREEEQVRAAAEAAPATELVSAAEPSRGAEPFVNETMAQLYLQQGYRQLALSVYRQLSASRPQDQSLRDRIAEIEAADAADHPGEAPMMRRDEPSIEPPAEPAPPRSPSIESPTPWSQPGSEQAPSIAAREPSIREFFATLGRRRPPRATGTSGIRSPNRAPEPAAPLGGPVPGASLDTVFAGATVSPSDARAASRLAGAFSGTTGAAGTRTPATPPMPTPRVNPRVPQAQESEEDVAKFRAWLDGLTRE